MAITLAQINEVTFQIMKPSIIKNIAEWGLWTEEQLTAMSDKDLKKVIRCFCQAMDPWKDSE